MTKIENFAKPVNSHLILFDQPKVATVKGFIERVFGMLISQHVDNYGSIVTNRTILTDEELNSSWNINNNDDDALESLHYFKDFPNLSMKDIKEVIKQTNGTRELSCSFYDLNELGAIVPASDAPLEMHISDFNNKYTASGKEIGAVDFPKGWIPLVFEELYAIQRYLKRPIKLSIDERSGISQETLCFMQELLDNQFKHKIFAIDLYYSDNESFINDGVHTYSSNGVKVAMTREEFIAKHPGCYEL